jgi:hypothetical protein
MLFDLSPLHLWRGRVRFKTKIRSQQDGLTHLVLKLIKVNAAEIAKNIDLNLFP